MSDWSDPRSAVSSHCCILVWLLLLSLGGPTTDWELAAAETAATAAAPPESITNESSSAPHYEVRAYVIDGKPLLAANAFKEILSKHVGANVGLEELARAASDLQLEYQKRAYPPVSIAFAQNQITNGIVTMHVFQGALPQILVSGEPYSGSTNGTGVASNRSSATATPIAATRSPVPPAATASATNAAPPATAKATPTFPVRAYEIRGDTLLSTPTLMSIFVKYTGTNIGVAEILKAGSELGMEYRNRGYPTVNVTIPPQQITNGIVKIRVFQGRLSDIVVTNNHYFSSANILRLLPSLHTNLILVGPVFQAEVDRANANQDRQIYPQIEPGPRENTTRLILDIKDRLPLHAKAEFNNQSSPGTPDLRVNTSAVYNNLWQHEHSIGVQYSFSPEAYKVGKEWKLYDKPLVANYSGFYRLPLGNPEAVEHVIESNSGSFGYDEASRKFRLPAPSGRPELNFYASRSTIDTGLETLFRGNLYASNNVSLDRQDVQRDLTKNGSLGARLGIPLSSKRDSQSGVSFGIDYKTYELASYKTNIFTKTDIQIDDISNPSKPRTNILTEIDYSPVPSNGVTVKRLEYLPLSLHYDLSLRDALGVTAVGLGISGNAWFSGSVRNLQTLTSSTDSGGKWLILSPSLSRDFVIRTNWTLSIRGDGQWASEPLISNEQFGAGGVASVRGYREGEVFGDTGWHVGVEQKTPPHIVGTVFGKSALVVRGSVFTDYAETYLLDPQGRKARVPLWGAGVGGAASIGSHWEARFLFSCPLLTAGLTQKNEPRFNFALVAQF